MRAAQRCAGSEDSQEEMGAGISVDGRPGTLAEPETHVRLPPIQVYAAQLITIRHMVIWLDPRSRERDLLAAVVDR